MISIVQEPQAINFSKSIPDLLLTSDKDSVTMEIYDLELIISEKYDIPPANIPLRIKLKGLFEHFLLNDRPDYTNDIHIHNDASKSFTLKLIDDNSAIELSFWVINGYLTNQTNQIDFFLSNYWMNLSASNSEVYFHQPLYLTAFPKETLNIKVKAKMLDLTEKIIDLGSMQPYEVQSVNINPGRLIQLLEGPYEYFDVYAENIDNELTLGYKRFYFVKNYKYLSDVFLYRNRLGGWDTLVLNGEKTLKHNNAPYTAIVQDIEFAYHHSNTLEFEKNTGFIYDLEQYRQYIDFLYSEQKYFLHEGNLTQIVTSENKTESIKGLLTSYKFNFRLENTVHVYPEIGQTPYNILIS